LLGDGGDIIGAVKAVVVPEAVAVVGGGGRRGGFEVEAPRLRADSAGETVKLPDGRTLSQRELCLEALRLNPKLSLVLKSLADLLSPGESVTLPDGRTMDRAQLLAEADRLQSAGT